MKRSSGAGAESEEASVSEAAVIGGTEPQPAEPERHDRVEVEGVSAEPVDACLGPGEFSAIISAYETPLLRYLKRTANPDDIEDVAQEAFLRLHRELELRGAVLKNVAAFLFKVAHNLAIDSLRRRQAREELKRRATQELEAPANDTPEALTALIRRAAAEKALQELSKLPPHERRILLLKVIQDFSLRDIAEIMGMTFGNVAYHLNVGLRTLARRLKDAGVI